MTRILNRRLFQPQTAPESPSRPPSENVAPATTLRQGPESVRELRNFLRMEEDIQYFDEEYQFMEESWQRTDELLQQLLQAVAVMQADIARIDETHS